MKQQQRPMPTNHRISSTSASVNPPKIKNIVCEADHEALRESYTFLPPLSKTKDQRPNVTSSTWQDRMVQSYHDHLYKEYALADLSRGPGQIGLRWRTKQEVMDGRGERTCGNKHCSIGESQTNMNTMPPLITLEVPFSYQERGVKKIELVKLRLCPLCLPRVKVPKEKSTTTKSKTIEQSHSRPQRQESSADEQSSTTGSSSSSSSPSQRRRRKRRKIRKEERRR
jgi:protein FRA10AC1